MDAPSIFFCIFASLMILASLTVVLARNPLYNVLSLVVAIFALSSLFILMEAFFVGIILLLVYAGAVLVFFLFVVMCLNLNTETFTQGIQNRFQLLGYTIAAMFFAQFYMVIKTLILHPFSPAVSLRGNIENIGEILFTQYLLPFELTSFLLLIAIFGIVSLAQGALNTRKRKVAS